jgi:hypothetical protein
LRTITISGFQVATKAVSATVKRFNTADYDVFGQTLENILATWDQALEVD